MERKVIPIKSDIRTFFRQYVRLIQPILKVSNKDADVLGELLYYNHKYKDLTEDIRYKIIMDYDTRTEIRSNLKIPEASFNNSLTSLRKAGLLINNKIPNNLIPIPTSNRFCLTYLFSINDSKSV